MSAVQAGRIPLIDAADALGAEWLASGFPFQDYRGKPRTVGLSSFVDNIYSTGVTADAAVATLVALEAFLARKWRLAYGSDSKSVMQARDAPDGEYQPPPESALRSCH